MVFQQAAQEALCWRMRNASNDGHPFRCPYETSRAGILNKEFEILRLIHSRGALSRAELVALTGLSAGLISAVVRLITQDLVVESMLSLAGFIQDFMDGCDNSTVQIE